MRNLIGIEDVVKVNFKGDNASNILGNGKIAKVIEIQQLPDKTIHYTAVYHCDCPDGGEGYDSAIQFGEGEYEFVSEYVPEQLPLQSDDEVEAQVSENINNNL